jgi:hypothetical protein
VGASRHAKQWAVAASVNSPMLTHFSSVCSIPSTACRQRAGDTWMAGCGEGGSAASRLGHHPACTPPALEIRVHDLEVGVQVVQRLYHVKRHLAPPAAGSTRPQPDGHANSACNDARKAQHNGNNPSHAATAVHCTPLLPGSWSSAVLLSTHLCCHRRLSCSSGRCMAALRLPPSMYSIASIITWPCSEVQMQRS